MIVRCASRLYWRSTPSPPKAPHGTNPCQAAERRVATAFDVNQIDFKHTNNSPSEGESVVDAFSPEPDSFLNDHRHAEIPGRPDMERVLVGGIADPPCVTRGFLVAAGE